MKASSTLPLVLTLVTVCTPTFAEDGIEIPVYPNSAIESNDAMQASKPNQMMRDLTYTARATPDELLDFYRDSPFVKKCEPNDMADNYLCELNKHKGILLGTLAIDKKMRGGETEVYANYFYTKK